MSLETWISEEPTKLTSGLASQRAILAWRRIEQGGSKSPTIAFKTPTGTIAGQRMRVESDSRSNVTTSAAGTAPKRQVTLFGIKDHPSEPDTIVEKGYTFEFENERYVVRDVIYTLGEVQVITEATR